jgi:hypothetical protein
LKKKKNFTQVENELIRWFQKTITPAQFGFLLFVMSFKSPVYLRAEDIKDFTGISPNTQRRAVKRLTKLGVLSVEGGGWGIKRANTFTVVPFGEWRLNKKAQKEVERARNPFKYIKEKNAKRPALTDKDQKCQDDITTKKAEMRAPELPTKDRKIERIESAKKVGIRASELPNMNTEGRNTEWKIIKRNIDDENEIKTIIIPFLKSSSSKALLNPKSLSDKERWAVKNYFFAAHLILKQKKDKESRFYQEMPRLISDFVADRRELIPYPLMVNFIYFERFTDSRGLEMAHRLERLMRAAHEDAVAMLPPLERDVTPVKPNKFLESIELGD